MVPDPVGDSFGILFKVKIAMRVSNALTRKNSA